MQVKIVGIQTQDYTLDSGYSFKGEKIHAIDLETVANGQVGQQVTTFKIPSTKVIPCVLEVGKEYVVYFTQKGAVDFVSPLK